MVTLGVGQRTDVIVTANYTANSSFWMRSNITGFPTLQPQALAALYYDRADTNSTPRSTPQVYTPTSNNDPLDKTEPFYAIPAGNPATTQQIDITVAPNATGSWLWSMNGQTFRGNLNNPTLLLAKTGNASQTFEKEWNTIDVGTNASYRFVVNNKTPAPHP